MDPLRWVRSSAASEEGKAGRLEAEGVRGRALRLHCAFLPRVQGEHVFFPARPTS